MEFTIDYNTIDQLKPDESGIVILKPYNISSGFSQNSSKLSKIIDLLGNLSAKVKKIIKKPEN